jgi:hypothetical protein
MRRLIAVTAMGIAFALVPLGASAAPTSFQLVFDGHTVLAGYPSPSGAAHVGTFTTNSALCPSGSGQDTAETDLGLATRLFTCDGSGATFTATINPHIGEYEGSGSWQIISGTGPLTDLRGEGTFSSVLTSGDLSDIPGNLLALAFHSTWTGTVALDATPPTLTLTTATATKLKRPAGTYKVKLDLALGDSGGGPVSYTLTLVDPATLDTLVRKSGTTSTGSVAWTFSLKPRARARSLRLEVDASDQVGNQSTLKHAIPLTK